MRWLTCEVELQAVVITMPTIESTFSTFVTKTVNTYDHADIPALAVAIEVMNALESFLWVRLFLYDWSTAGR